jgi:adenosylhomocysteinase
MVVSVTSADDEFDFRDLGGYEIARLPDLPVSTCRRSDHQFFLANHGNAVNFIHGAEVRPYIHLVQAMILVGIGMLSERKAPPGQVTPIPREREAKAAEMFEEAFFSARERAGRTSSTDRQGAGR